MVEFHDKTGAPIPDLDVTARFEHPFDAALDRSVTARLRRRRLRGVATPVGRGRWTLIIEGSRGARADVPQREQDHASRTPPLESDSSERLP